MAWSRFVVMLCLRASRAARLSFGKNPYEQTLVMITMEFGYSFAKIPLSTERPLLVFHVSGWLYFRPMSIRKGGGDWEPMLLGIEPRNCTVCKEGLYRDKTFFTGGWSRCALCEEFVHYSCLASGKVSFLKARPRVCKTCRAAQGGIPSPSPKAAAPVAVGS
jgi:hypothetical protein